MLHVSSSSEHVSGGVSGIQPLIQSIRHNTSLTMALFTIIDSHFHCWMQQWGRDWFWNHLNSSNWLCIILAFSGWNSCGYSLGFLNLISLFSDIFFSKGSHAFQSPLSPTVLSLKHHPALTLSSVRQQVCSQLGFTEAVFCTRNLWNQLWILLCIPYLGIKSSSSKDDIHVLIPYNHCNW